MGGIETNQQVLENDFPKFVTCSVSLEHSLALDSFYKLIELGYDVHIELLSDGRSELKIWGVNSLRQLKKDLNQTALEVRKIDKKNYSNQTGQRAKAQVGKIEINIYPNFDTNVFEGCHVVYSDVEVPEQTIPAHKEKKATIICNGNEGVSQ